jgi:UDP-N-acetylmuramoylalanine--D-glutamate ligase
MSGQQRYLVVGFGVTGRAVASWALAAGAAAVVVEDRPGPASVDAAGELGVEFVERPSVERLADLVASVDVVVPSPGVPVEHPVYALAERAHRPVLSEIELAWSSLDERGVGAPRLVAITGTNGKTTVTTLVTAMLRASGVDAIAGGNIGRPLIETVAERTAVVVAEVSSFQLQFTARFHPRVSCWLNLTEDHLDWHPDLGHYAAAKARVWANQRAGDTAVYALGDPVVRSAAALLAPGVTRVGFALDDPEAVYRVEAGRLVASEIGAFLEVAELPRALPHDLTNSLAAAAVARAAGAGWDGITDALRQTPPPAHRVQFVGEGGGVSWYDDSKATTPASVQAAVAGFASVVLIAGGRNKGLDLGPLSATAPPVHAVVAIGESAEEVAAAFEGRAPVVQAASMADAVRSAAELSGPGDAVVLSPGCTSFDWYGSYAERGDHFTTLVRERPEISAAGDENPATDNPAIRDGREKGSR